MSQLRAELTDATGEGPVSRWRSTRDLRRRARQRLDGSDEDVLGWIARGNVDAVAVLHHRRADLVHANALRVLGDPVLAEQVTEELFRDVATLAGRFDAGCEDARMWLLALAHERATGLATDYGGVARSAAAIEPSTTSRATRLSLRLLRRA